MNEQQPAGSWECAREADREIAIERLATLEAWEAVITGGPDKWRRTLEYVAHRNMTLQSQERLSRSTLYRWGRAYRERGREGLLPGWSTGPQDQALAPEIRDRFDQVYLAPQRISISIARRIVHGQLALEGSPLAQAGPPPATVPPYL